MNKFLAILALASAARAGAIGYSTSLGAIGIAAPVLRQPLIARAAPVAYAQPAIAAVRAVEPFDPNPQYSYGYSVSDALTGDSKTATETRNGDLVQGEYSLVEPDGAIRTVRYTSDSINGFNAVVDRQPPAVIAKTVAAQPLLATTIGQPALATRAILG